jgi:UTP-glucose-1-phosphate uridylyltransferase
MVEKPKGKKQPEELDVPGRIILKWVLQKYVGRVCIEFICLTIGTSGGLL